MLVWKSIITNGCQHGNNRYAGQTEHVNTSTTLGYAQATEATKRRDRISFRFTQASNSFSCSYWQIGRMVLHSLANEQKY